MNEKRGFNLMLYLMTKKGSYHEKHRKANQDFIMHKEDDRYIALSLADGVSSCKYAKKGAKIACSVISEMLMNHAERFFEIDSNEAVCHILSKIKYELEKTAKNHDIEEYSSTLVCVLYDRIANKVFYFSLGDSLIIAIKDKNCKIVAQPCDSRDGCYVTTTENAEYLAKSGIIDSDSIESIMLCSDGAWNLMYNRGRIDSEIKYLLTGKRFDILEKVLTEKNSIDDCSFISLNLSEFREEQKNGNKSIKQTKLPGRGRYCPLA